jgi:hypothetical protein
MTPTQITTHLSPNVDLQGPWPPEYLSTGGRPAKRNDQGTCNAKSQKLLATRSSATCSPRSTPSVTYRISVQLAAPGDEVNDATVRPDLREKVEFGTVTLTERVNELDPENRKIVFDPTPSADVIEPSDAPLFEVRAALYLLSGRRRRAAGARTCDRRPPEMA